MTGKERNVLDGIRDDIMELKVDMKAVMAFVNTYQERSRHCESKFIDLEKMARVNRKTLLIFTGGISAIGFGLGLVVKFIK